MPSIGEVAGAVAFGVTGAGLALGVGAETTPAQRVGEATIEAPVLGVGDSTYSQISDEIACIEAAVEAQELGGEQVMPDPECATDPNQARADALATLGYPPEATAYVSTEDGGVVGEAPSHEAVLGELVEAKEHRAKVRVQLLGSAILAATALATGARLLFGRNGTSAAPNGKTNGGGGPAPTH